MQPRERLISAGSAALTDQELVATILGTGNSKVKIGELAKRVLNTIESKNDQLKIEDLMNISGIGQAKACQLFASLEYGRRRMGSADKKISAANDLIPYLLNYANKKQEHLLCISLNGAHQIIQIRVVSIGLVNTTQVHPREVFADPITDRACAVIIAHNHPSGKLDPSEEDISVTLRLEEASKILGIKLLDHIIFSIHGYYSFAEQGKIHNHRL